MGSVEQGRRASVTLLALALIGVVGLVGTYLFGPARFWFSSDDAARCLTAEVAVRQGRYVPQDWAFQNGDLPFLAPYALNVLLYPMMGVSFPAHAMAGFLSYLFLLASLAAFCQRAYGDLETTLLATLILASGLSALTLLFLIAQGGPYVGLVALSLCLFGLALDPPPAVRPDAMRRAILVALVALLLAGANPLRASFLTLAPLAFTLVVLRFSHPPPPPTLGSPSGALWRFALPVGVGALCGAWLHYAVLLPAVTNVNAVTTTRVASLETMKEHLWALPGAWLSFLHPLAGRGPASAFETGLSVCGGLLSLGLFAGVAMSLWRPPRVERNAYAVGWLAACCILLPLGALVVSGSLYKSPLEIRYAMLGIVLAIPVTVATMKRALGAHRRARMLATTALALFSVGLAGQWHSAHHAPDHLVAQYDERHALLEALNRHQVRLLLATYWNSYVLSVSSRGFLRSFPIVLSDTGVGRETAFSYLGADLDVPEGRSAIALTEAEGASASVWEGVRSWFGPPRFETRSGPFRIWIYDTPRLHWALGAGPRIDREVPESRLLLEVERKHVGGPCEHPNGCVVRMRVRNAGPETLSSRGDRPLRVGLQALDRTGSVLLSDVARVNFVRTLAPGDGEEVKWRLPRNENPLVTDYRVCLLQEPATWLCHRTWLSTSSPDDSDAR